MKLKLDIDLSNAAFGEHPGEEVAAILRRFADQVQHYDNLRKISGTFMALNDHNGNTVGHVSMGRKTSR